MVAISLLAESSGSSSQDLPEIRTWKKNVLKRWKCNILRCIHCKRMIGRMRCIYCERMIENMLERKLGRRLRSVCDRVSEFL